MPPRDADAVGVVVPDGGCAWEIETRGARPARRTLRLPAGAVLLHSLACAHRPAATSQAVYQMVFRTAEAELAMGGAVILSTDIVLLFILHGEALIS